jgi:hypothetical protein
LEEHDHLRLVAKYLVPLVRAGNRELAHIAQNTYYQTKHFLIVPEYDEREVLNLRYPIQAQWIRNLHINMESSGFGTRRGKVAVLEDLLVDPESDFSLLLHATKELDANRNALTPAFRAKYPNWHGPNNEVQTRWQRRFPNLDNLHISIDLSRLRDSAFTSRWMEEDTCFGDYNIVALKELLQDTEILITARKNVKINVACIGCHLEPFNRARAAGVFIDDSHFRDEYGYLKPFRFPAECKCEKEVGEALQALVKKWTPSSHSE